MWPPRAHYEVLLDEGRCCSCGQVLPQDDQAGGKGEEGKTTFLGEKSFFLAWTKWQVEKNLLGCEKFIFSPRHPTFQTRKSCSSRNKGLHFHDSSEDSLAVRALGLPQEEGAQDVHSGVFQIDLVFLGNSQPKLCSCVHTATLQNCVPDGQQAAQTDHFATVERRKLPEMECASA